MSKAINPSSIMDMALNALENAKTEEAIAKTYRIKAENKVIELMGKLKDEGANTTKTDFYKVTVTTKINRSIDPTKMALLESTLPDELHRQLVKWRASFDLKTLRYLMLNEPEIYSQIAPAITAKPAKALVKVEQL